MSIEVVANVVVHCSECPLSANCPLRSDVVKSAMDGRRPRVVCSRFFNFGKGEVVRRYEDVAAEVLSRIYPSLKFTTLDSIVSLRSRVAECLGLDYSVVMRSLGIGEVVGLMDGGVEDVILDEDQLVINFDSGDKRVLKNPWPHLPNRLLRLGLLSGSRIDERRPYVKYSIKLGKVRMRIVVEVPPLVSRVRAYVRFHTKPLTALNLVALGTISLGQLSSLVSSLLKGKNVVIVGPPSSGKTTLLNALDTLIPPRLHRVYIDEADETLDCPNIPQTKIRAVGPKIVELFRAMHRSPDVLVIGELQYREHFKALAHAVELGVSIFYAVY